MSKASSGVKIQAYSDDPRRLRDLADIQAACRTSRVRCVVWLKRLQGAARSQWLFRGGRSADAVAMRSPPDGLLAERSLESRAIAFNLETLVDRFSMCIAP